MPINVRIGAIPTFSIAKRKYFYFYQF